MNKKIKTFVNALAIVWIVFATINILEIVNEKSHFVENGIITYAYASEGCKSNCSGCEFNRGPCLSSGSGRYCGLISNGTIYVECYECTGEGQEECDEDVED